MAKQIEIVAWDHIVVRVTNIEKSLQFYKQNLGFKPEVDVEIEGEGLSKILSGHVGRQVGDAKARLVLGRVGGQLVELIHYEVEDDSGLGKPGISAFTLRVADATEAYEACQERGLDPESEPVEIEGSRQFFISDPDGIRIEMTQPPKY